MNFPKSLLSAALCLSALLSPTVRAADADALVAQMPAKTNAAETPIAAELAKLGPAGLKQVCAMLAPLGVKDDTSARYAISAVERYACTPGHEADRQMLAAVLCEALTTQADPEVRSFLLERLKSVGDNASVSAVAAYLSDDRLCHHACGALERIATPEAAAALAKALPASEGARRIAIIKSLGRLKDTSALEEIRKSAASPDSALRLTALWALASAGDIGLRELLPKAEQSASGAFERSRLASFELLLVERRLAADPGEAAAARAIVAKYAEAKEVDRAIAALHRLAQYTGDKALPDLLAAVDSPRVELRNGALNAAALIKGEPATAQWVAKLAKSDRPEVRTDIAAFLGRRGDRSAAPGLVAAAKTAPPAAASDIARALMQLDPAAAEELLTAWLRGGNQPTVELAQSLYARLKGDEPFVRLAKIAQESATGQEPMLEVLAARPVPAAWDSILAVATSSTDLTARTAALKALEKLATPARVADLMKLVAKAQDQAEADSAIKAATAAALQAPAGDERAAAFIAAARAADGTKRAALLRALVKLGGAAAVKAVVADLSSATPAHVDAALRALAEGSDDSAAASLLDAAGNDKLSAAQQVLAVRGAIQVLRKSESAGDAKVGLYARAMKVAKRADEKKLALGALSGEHSVAAVEVAAAALDDEALKPEASLAVVKIAAPTEKGQKGLTGPKVIAALEKAIPNCPDATAKAAAQKHLASIKKK